MLRKPVGFRCDESTKLGRRARAFATVTGQQQILRQLRFFSLSSLSLFTFTEPTAFNCFIVLPPPPKLPRWPNYEAQLLVYRHFQFAVQEPAYIGIVLKKRVPIH